MSNYIEKILEFDKIKESLSGFAKIQKTKAMILDMHKIDNYSDIVKSIDEVDEAYKNINLAGYPSILPIEDISDPLSHLKILSSLTIEEIYNISKVLTVTKNMIDYHEKYTHDNLKTTHDDIHKSILKNYVEKLTDLSSLNKEINMVIQDDLTINDNASAELSNIRKKLKAIQTKIDSVSNKVLEKYADKLNDTVLSLKDGKLCLQVKSEFSNQIDGIVHDVSGTRTTIFIEPKELTIISNEENELKGLEKIEINKILKKLSNMLIPYVDSILANYENIIYLDFIYAKANYAKNNNQTKPILNNDGHINLIKAIHPLLDK
ncbi:MAG: hypothetical protein MJ151_04325, partial [Lachnospiraceae bacterium]|nr:hypothetical protein [Lachnospiraceae bacterium]